MTFSFERDVASLSSPLEAQPLVDFLRDNGVEAHLRDEDDWGGMNPALAFAHGTYVVVPAEQLERAKELLVAYQQAPTEQVPELAPEPGGPVVPNS